jgi:hypothetical protein
MDGYSRMSLLLCSSYFFLCLFVCSFMMVVAHNNVITVQAITPLDDLMHRLTPSLMGNGMEMCEVVALTLLVLALITLLIRVDRVLLWCRLATIAGTVFLLRAASMFMTTIPIPHPAIECSGRVASTPWEYLQRTVDVYIHGGLYINGVKICGDYMFSGHTSGVTLLSLFICHYIPAKLRYMKMVIFGLNILGTFFIICAREHYSVDILIALVICILCFNYYHTLVDAKRTSSWMYPSFPFAEQFYSVENAKFQWPFSHPHFLAQALHDCNVSKCKSS